MSKRVRYALLTVAVAFACAIAGFVFVVNRIAHRGDGPRHTYPLSGSDVLTDEQAIALARQTLQLDGRYSDAMEQVVFGNDILVNRGDDDSKVNLGWRVPGTNKIWYVQLHRTPGRVRAVSYPGK